MYANFAGQVDFAAPIKKKKSSDLSDLAFFLEFKVTTKHNKWPKKAQKKALVEGKISLQELEEGSLSGPYLLVVS